MSFRDIKLQDKAVEFLQASIAGNRLSHSLLFSGPEAVGKRSAALALAKALNCETAGPSDCCDSCPSCARITGRNHPDVMWIEPDGSGNVIKIERIRDMKRRIGLKPFEGRAKVFIIDRAHLLADAAASAMLKTLEEPPANSVIILVSDDAYRMLPTLRSRCQWVLFRASTPEEVTKFLINERGAPEEEARFLSHFSEGRIGRAISAMANGSLAWKNGVLDRFSKKGIIFDEDEFFFKAKRSDLLGMMDVLTSWYRDMFVIKSGADGSLVINIDRLDKLKAGAGSLEAREIKEMLEETIKTRYYLERNANAKLALSNLAGRMT